MVTQYLHDLYENETWKQEHDDAMRCWDLEQVVAIGLRILGSIDARSDMDRVTVSVGLVQAEAYLWWLDRSAQVVDAIRQLRAKDYEVEKSVQFLRRYRDLSNVRGDIEEMAAALRDVKNGHYTVLDPDALLCSKASDG